ncbi:two-component regulator propeller domain-containing protein [soil metagenome]
MRKQLILRHGWICITPIILLLLIAQSFSLQIFAQHQGISFKKINIENGLSNSTIETIFQDNRGFMWFGTRDGLNRFDGYQVLTYKYNPTDSQSVSDNYITSIFQGDDKFIWIGTINGLNRFDPSTNNFKRYYNKTPVGNNPGHNHITRILRGPNNAIWVSTFGAGIYLLDTDKNVFTNIDINPANGKLQNFVNTLFEDKKGSTWAGTEAGLYHYNTVAGNFVAEPRFIQSNQKPYSISVIKEDNEHNLLLGTSDNGLIIYDPRFKIQQQFTHDDANTNSISSNLVRDILVTKAGNIWTGTVNGGLDYFDQPAKKFTNYQYRPDNPASLSQRTVSALLEDNQGNIWIGTHRGGINLYVRGIEKFNLYRQSATGNSLSYNDVKCFSEDKNGNIWIGTDGGGLNLFNRQTNTFKHYKYSHSDNGSIGSNEVIDVMKDSEGKIWVGTWGGGLCRYLEDGDRFIRYQQNGNGNAPRYIQTIFEDSRHRFWIATYFDGLYLFNRKDNSWTHVEQSASGKTQLAGKNILSVIEDKSSNIWISTDDGGLNRLDAVSGEFKQYFNTEDKKPDLRVLFIDNKGNLWVGQSGLYQYNHTSDSFSLYNKAALDKEFIKGIIEDNKGNLWVSTSNGITVVNADKNGFRKYNMPDGLQGAEFEANSFLQTTDGQLFFGGVNGFNAFYPNEIISNNFVPPVFITSFQVNNTRVTGGPHNKELPQDISYTDMITLSYKESTFSFGFAALNYTISENNEYAYMLENWDKNWVNAGNEKKASYTNVSPGTYTFHVKASNNDGVWNDAGYSIVVVVAPPFWQTWWFRTIIAMLVLAVGIYFYQFKRKLELERFEERKKEEMHQLQLQFFTNISHEFRTPLSLITGPVEKLMKEHPESKENHTYKLIQKNANRLLQLINELMDFRKAESGILKLQVMQGNIVAFLNELSEEFSELSQQKNIRFSISAAIEKKDAWFDRQMVEKMITNLLSNSFKYTAQNGTVTLEVFNSLENIQPLFSNELVIKNNYKGKQTIYFRVADNGCGMSKESLPHLFERYFRISDHHLGSGIGLAFVKTLVQLHKGDIYVYSERNKGTEIIIGIPCSKDDYAGNERWPREQNDQAIKLESLVPVTNTQVLSIAENRILQADENAVNATILIADDNDELRIFLKEILDKQYTIIEAINGEAALDQIQEHLPDIIISDIMMPVMDGITFCKKIKTNIETSHIPFIMLTAKDSMDARIEGAETGADHYFSKPVSMDLLQLTLRNTLSQKEKLKKRYQNDYNVEIKELVTSSKDKIFLTDLINIIEANLSRPELDIDFVCTQIGMSRTKLYNKIKGITGQAMGDFIRTIRLKKAAQLMVETDTTITEAMYSVGIQTQSYFSKAFKAEFGKTPTQFLQEFGRKKGESKG